jgi:hypothetical protein
MKKRKHNGRSCLCVYLPPSFEALTRLRRNFVTLCVIKVGPITSIDEAGPIKTIIAVQLPKKIPALYGSDGLFYDAFGI